MQLSYAMRRVTPVAGALAALVLPACSSTPDGPSATIVSMEMTVGDETVAMDADGTVTGTVTLSGTEALEAVFFDEAGAPVAVSGTEFTLSLSPADTNRVQYIPTGPFDGALEGRIVGPTTLDVSVLEVLAGVFAFGPFEVQVTVQ